MKLFRYPMQSVLDYRKDVEEEEKQKFAEALKEYLQQKEILNDFEQKLNDAFLVKADSSKHRVYELKNLSQYIQYLKEKKDIQEQLVMETEREMEVRRQELISAQKDRKIIEKHKEKSLNQYLSELNQAEQKTIDELALYSYMRR
jgi:flagellar FliJ protein